MFVYIFEDGTTQMHQEPPTPLDLSYVNDGLLMVLNCDSVEYIDSDGSCGSLPECKITDIDDKKFGYCHIPS
jgi:hypothetical protein